MFEWSKSRENVFAARKRVNEKRGGYRQKKLQVTGGVLWSEILIFAFIWEIIFSRSARNSVWQDESRSKRNTLSTCYNTLNKRSDAHRISTSMCRCDLKLKMLIFSRVWACFCNTKCDQKIDRAKAPCTKISSQIIKTEYFDLRFRINHSRGVVSLNQCISKQ